MNPIYFPIITATVALITLVFAIFGANWLNQRTTERIIEALRSEMRAEFGTIRAEMRADKSELRVEIAELRSEVKRLDQKIDSIGQTLARIDRQIEAIFKPALPR